MENQVLVIMRGLPGSGKTRFARNIHAHASLLPTVQLPAATPAIASADDWFQTEEGWKFDSAQLGAAHNGCFCYALYLMQEERAPLVVVDNTNMTQSEIAPYWMLGGAFGYNVVIVHILPPYDLSKLVQRNVHGVPEQAIYDMAQKKEYLPPHWREVSISAQRLKASEPLNEVSKFIQESRVKS